MFSRRSVGSLSSVWQLPPPRISGSNMQMLSSKAAAQPRSSICSIDSIRLNTQLAENDSHSSYDEATAELKLSANAQAAQATRGTELTRIGSEKAGIVKRAQKAFHALQGCFSAYEFALLRHQYASAFNKAVATSDPRQLLDIVKEHWRLSIVSQSWFGRIVTVFSGAGISLEEDSQSHTLQKFMQSFDEEDGDVVDLGTYAYLGNMSPHFRDTVLPALERRLQEPGGYAYLNSRSCVEFAALLDVEAQTLPPPPSRAASRARVNTALSQPPQTSHSQKWFNAPCTVHLGRGHSHGKCKAQAAVQPGADAAAVPVMCHLCQQPGHHLPNPFRGRRQVRCYRCCQCCPAQRSRRWREDRLCSCRQEIWCEESAARSPWPGLRRGRLRCGRL